MKPTMTKIGGAWIWECEHPTGARVGDVFDEEHWRNAWDACLGAVTKHAALYHNDVEPFETIELT
jgi:hypothetical protein